MDEAIEAIRVALAADSTAEQKLVGVGACRAILKVLEPQPVESTPAATPTPSPAPQVPTPNVAQIIAAMRGLPPEQLMDLAIARLRAALPTGTTVPNAQPLKLQLIPVPPGIATGPKK